MTTYIIAVPVYVNLCVEREEGMTKEQIIKSIEWDELGQSDADYISETLEQKLLHNVGPKCEVKVEAID